MNGNICAECLEMVKSLENMRSASEWGVCKVCGETGVFYAREDELLKAKEIAERVYNKFDKSEKN